MLKDLKGQTFTLLTVLRRGKRRDIKHVYWLCRCVCSRRKEIRGDSLRDGSIRSCGCLPRGRNPEDITGQRFGRLIALRRIESTARRLSRWLCKCRCGRVVTVRLDQLRDGTTKSCGCWYRDSRTVVSVTHGHARFGSRTAVFAAYQRQKSWCRCPTNRHFKYYGAKGIRFLFDNFAAFLAEVGDKPAGNYWLMRRDSDADFAPGELVWVQKKLKRKRTRA
jgi:hypothetical protein